MCRGWGVHVRPVISVARACWRPCKGTGRACAGRNGACLQAVLPKPSGISSPATECVAGGVRIHGPFLRRAVRLRTTAPTDLALCWPPLSGPVGGEGPPTASGYRVRSQQARLGWCVQVLRRVVLRTAGSFEGSKVGSPPSDLAGGPALQRGIESWSWPGELLGNAISGECSPFRGFMVDAERLGGVYLAG